MADGISYAPVDATTRAHWLYYMRALNGLMQSHYSGWESLADYMQLLDGRTAQNTITHLPYAHLRAMACGWDRRVPDDVQMEEILAGVERGMAEGAVGISTGLDYIAECFATTDELVEACTAMAAQQGLYATHVRYKKGTLAGVQEAVEIGRRARRPSPHFPLQGHLPPANRRIAVRTWIKSQSTRWILASMCTRTCPARPCSTSCCPMRCGRTVHWVCYPNSTIPRSAAASPASSTAMLIPSTG